MIRYRFLRFFVAAVLLHAGLLHADDTLPALERLKSCEPRIALSAAKEILNDPRTQKEPIEMFSPAFVLFKSGDKDEAVFWFYAAQLRTRYQLVFQKGDRGQLLQIMLMTIGGPINNHAFQDVQKLDRLLERVLAWDQATPNPHRQSSLSAEAAAGIEKVYTGFRDLRTKMLAEKDDIEKRARAEAQVMAQMVTRLGPPPCKAGEPDPAHAGRITELETMAVVEFVRTNETVLREVGAIQGAHVSSSRRAGDSLLPSRYSVSVGGARGRGYAEVDVTRHGERATFKLACITQLGLGQRDPRKDVCTP